MIQLAIECGSKTREFEKALKGLSTEELSIVREDLLAYYRWKFR